MSSLLRGALVIDYQNVHMTAHDIFGKPKGADIHESLIHPVHLASVIEGKKQDLYQQDPSKDFRVRINTIEVYRGLPSPQVNPEGHRRNIKQRSLWETSAKRAKRHLTVSLRPLKYRKQWDAEARKYIENPSVPPVEKGVDVMVALACVRLAARNDIDVIFLASRDSDLKPALEDVQANSSTHIETVSWYEPTNRTTHGRLDNQVWNTRLDEACYRQALDLNPYF
jgi:hypothetical protein